MKVRIFKQADGTIDILVKKTLPRENGTVLVRGVSPEKLEEKTFEVVDAVRRQLPGIDPGA